MAYFANGSEGEILDNQCGGCRFGERPCPIVMVQMAYNYDAIKNKLATKILNKLVDDKEGCILFNLFKKDLEIDYSEDKIISQRYANLIRQDQNGELRRTM